MNKNYLILLFQPRLNSVLIQANKRDSGNIVYNLHFNYDDNLIRLKGFTIPGLSGDYPFNIFGDENTRTMQHVLKVLPKIKDEFLNIPLFLSGLIKKEKLNYFQININGNFDNSNAEKIDLSTIANIMDQFRIHNIPTEF